MDQTYDGIILGAGHNGMILQAYLGKAGLKVLAIERKAVARMNLKTDSGPMFRSPAQALQLTDDFGLVALDHCLTISARMEFDDWRAELAGGVHHLDFRLHEEGHADAIALQLLNHGPQMGSSANDVEPPFGRPFLTLFRHEAAGMGVDAGRDLDHFRSRRHLEIERHEELALQPFHVLIADVPPVLTQVRSDPIGSGQHGHMGGPDRVRIDAPTGVPDGCNMVDIDAEAQRKSFHDVVLA